MHELEIIAEQSDRQRLVLRRAGDGTRPNTPDERFGIAVTAELLTALGLKATGKYARPVDGATPGPQDDSTTPADSPAGGTANSTGNGDNAGTGAPGSTGGASPSTRTPALNGVVSSAEQATGTREKIRVDARKPAPLKIPPKEIQKKLRAGASVRDVAEFCGVAESRIMPFALPVLHERARIAQLAKQAHPVRSDGPVRLSLSEVVAAALVARDADPADAVWDSHRDTSGQWVVTVTVPGGGEPAAWAFTNKGISSPTAVPNNAPAREITEPYMPAGRPAAAAAWDDDDDTDGDAESTAPATDGTQPAATHRERSNVSALRPADSSGQEALIDGPDYAPRPRKRKKRAETPHWEDVLLGVRTSKKNPRK
ncbi:septation protein SepH [Corynebacterium mendelii]|uniref:DUF3071 domain-containing protein n=1 Tax=Corynebacterium mendelii TaxID=2765362 RepID=A0A939E2N7_9CORY|nr:DUF3071 domain-containing protein [Corynebacterium mendelii]